MFNMKSGIVNFLNLCTKYLPKDYLCDRWFSMKIELFYLNSTLNFGIPTVLVFQLEVSYKVDRLLTGLTAQQKGTTARWYSNKTSLPLVPCEPKQRTIKKS